MRDFEILAASYLGPGGYGNHRNAFVAWPPHLQARFRKGELADLHWSLLFDSDPARFERMDLMSRLGLMAVKLLAAGLESKPAEWRDRTGVCVETCAGSLATDLSFLQTPRASLFAYTLPSTVIGEICIRYRLRGPVLCLVTPPGAGPETPGALVEAIDWLDQGEAAACLCVRSEGVDQRCADILPEGLAPSAWYGCAALVGLPDIELPRAETPALQSGTNPTPLALNLDGKLSLAELCRSLCSVPEQT